MPVPVRSPKWALLAIWVIAAAAPLATAAKCKKVKLVVERSSNSTLPPLAYTLYQGQPGSPGRLSLPTVFLLNGFNVPSVWYSDLCQALCSKGLTVATAEDTRELRIPGLPRPGCPANYTFITGAHLNALYNAEGLARAKQFQELARSNGVLLLGHSQGGAVGAALLNGTCDALSPAGPALGLLCDGYRPMQDSRGANLLKAAVLYEGYAAGPVAPGPSRLIAYIAGAYNNATRDAYNSTSGCKLFARLGRANHYGLANFVPGVAGSQVTPCARAAASDPASFHVSKAQQARNVALVSDIVLRVAKAFRAGVLLRGQPDLKGLRQKLVDLKSSCPSSLSSALNSSDDSP